MFLNCSCEKVIVERSRPGAVQLDVRQRQLPVPPLAGVPFSPERRQLLLLIDKLQELHLPSNPFKNVRTIGDGEIILIVGELKETQIHILRRKVQWTNTSGGELFEIREFELIDEDESGDEYGSGNERSCSCKMM
nr:transcription elongation factor SPT5-like [Ipomoea batatas]GMD48225.1 transcription elongation factor SPT5-like [Ipomoea batatas]GME08703.1 transcription elongation factor SPT5-like [Ipomoea batatas]